MTAVVYPPSLPAPSQWGGQPFERAARSALPGNTRLRGRSRDVMKDIDVAWVYSAAAMAAWVEWFDHTLLYGALWFALDAPGSGGWTERVLKFRTGTLRRELLGNGHFRISAKCQHRGISAAPRVVVPPPLVYWKLNEANGAVVGADSGSLGLPLSISAAQTSMGSTALSTTGTSMLVNSASANPATAATDAALGFGSGDFTLSAIIRTTSNGSIVGNGTTNVDWANWILYCTGGALVLRLASANGPAFLTFFTGSTTINDGTVHKVAARRRGTTITLTDNGVDVGSGTYTSPLWTPTSSVGVGCTPWTAGGDPSVSVLLGNVSNVAIWAEGLTDARLASHFASLSL